MGKFFSKEIIHSIDVSGHNNRVLMLCGVPLNISVILEDFTEHIVRENRKMIVNVALISIVVSLFLTIALIGMIFSCYMKYDQEYSKMFFERILQQIHFIQKLLVPKHLIDVNQCETFNKDKRREK